MMALSQDSAPRRVRAALMRKVAGDDAMFALGASIARVVEMASSDDHGTEDLAYYVVSDPALTQRILRLSNTVQYRAAGGGQVTTISRAISLLGFDNVRATALAMLLVDALDGGGHAGAVRAELQAALCASLVGREMARASFYQRAEEAAICALFKNLGPLLVASHEHERYREIAALVASGKNTPAQASQLILGSSYAALSEAVLSEWNIPDVIVRAQAPLLPETGPVPVAASRAEWMRQVASFGLDIARLMGRSHEPAQAPQAAALLQRYGAALGLDRARLEALFGTVQESMTALLRSMNIEPASKADTVEETRGGLPDVLLLATLSAGADEQGGVHPSGKPKNARDRLLAGLQDVTLLRTTGRGSVNEVVMAVLETLHGAMGFRFATVCLRDLRTKQYRARGSLGQNSAALQAGFVFPLESKRDLFHLALENDADMMIADARSPKIRDLLPPWHKTLLPDTESFIVLPLVLGKVQLGLFYADRMVPAPEGVPPDETALIKALKGQVLAALAGA